MRAAKLPAFGKKVLEINGFSGENFGKLSNGQLLDTSNVTVLSGGALYSLLSENKVNVLKNEMALSDGVYTFSEEYDASYETQIDTEWFYKNVCPESVIAYEDWQVTSSRIFVKSTNEEAKNEGGYRRVIGAFSDGENIFVFYEACYVIIDERRSAEISKLPKGYTVQFSSGDFYGDVGSIGIYALSQVFLDVIKPNGGIVTSLVDARLMLHKSITHEKYKKSTLISTDGKTFRYASLDYSPSLGETYSLNFDRVYTELYPTLENYAKTYFVYEGMKRIVRYSNKISGDGEFGSLGEKTMILPDMKLLNSSGGTWSIGSERADMPTLSAAVQYFDRLFGISGDTVYASVTGKCIDFEQHIDPSPIESWKMVTADKGGFTAITAYGGKVVVFTEERMMTVRGTELPFTLSFVGEHGCVSQDALTALDGDLYFVSKEGVMCYNGSSVKKISAPLPRTLDYSSSILCSDNGLLVLYLYDGGLWFYEPQSGQWTRRDFDVGEMIFVGTSAIAKIGDGSFLYRLFDDFGNFSFSVAISNGSRRRVKSISVTASTGLDSELTLVDENGNAQMCIYDTDGEAVTRTFLPRAFYLDNGKIRFEGRGECTLYAMRIEYAPLSVFTKRKG